MKWNVPHRHVPFFDIQSNGFGLFCPSNSLPLPSPKDDALKCSVSDTTKNHPLAMVVFVPLLCSKTSTNLALCRRL